MTITIADGRGALWQWDTGRRVKITDGDGVKQIHYQNRCFGRSVDVDVSGDGTAIIPDELLQDWHPLMAYAYVTDDAGGYTKVQVDFAVHKRARPADYVYTPTEHAGFDRLRAEIGDLADLTTEAKDTLVAAINEVARTAAARGQTLSPWQTSRATRAQQARLARKALPVRPARTARAWASPARRLARSPRSQPWTHPACPPRGVRWICRQAVAAKPISSLCLIRNAC